MAWRTVNVVPLAAALYVLASYWDREIINVAVAYAAFVAGFVDPQVTSGYSSFYLWARGAMVAEKVAFG
ncbi:MAG: hypothetical protein ABSH09_28395 [Bryobacteraceae bacterium]